MNRLSIFLVTLLTAIVGMAQTSDPVIMTIAGKQILRSEFEYSLNKNADSPASVTDQEIKDYVDLFINYKLKVEAALDAKLDTLSSFQKEYRTYRDIQLKPFVYDSVFVDSVAHAVYDVTKESVGDADLIRVSHIMLYVPQNSNKSLLDSQKQKIDSIYNAILAGADFAELAKAFSDDKVSGANGGQLPWIGPAQYYQEFTTAAYALKPGEMSEPILSPVGYHIILMNDRKPFGSYEDRKEEIYTLLNQRGIAADAAESMIRKMVANSNGTMTREDVLLGVQQMAEEKDPNLKFLIAEYYEGLLLYEACNRMVWQKAAVDEKGLDDFFKSNKSKYKWDSPRLRGYVYRAKSKVMAKKIGKILKSCKKDEGLAMLKEQLPADSMKFIKVHFGVYKQGDDAVADYVKFKTGSKPKENKVMPYYGATGKIYKQPADYIDVKAQVVADYQDYQEKNWINDLRKKYPVVVNQDVLATVNKH